MSKINIFAQTVLRKGSSLGSFSQNEYLHRFIQSLFAESSAHNFSNIITRSLKLKFTVVILLTSCHLSKILLRDLRVSVVSLS